MLDNECKLGQRGSNENWAKRLNDTYRHFSNKNQEIQYNNGYSASKLQQSKGQFCLRHFAGDAVYTAGTNVLEKNCDEIPLMARSLFEEDLSDLIKEMYEVHIDKSNGEGAEKGKLVKQGTVSQQFKVQLTSLLEMIETTDLHYV